MKNSEGKKLREKLREKEEEIGKKRQEINSIKTGSMMEELYGPNAIRLKELKEELREKEKEVNKLRYEIGTIEGKRPGTKKAIIVISILMIILGPVLILECGYLKCKHCTVTTWENMEGEEKVICEAISKEEYDNYKKQGLTDKPILMSNATLEVTPTAIYKSYSSPYVTINTAVMILSIMMMLMGFALLVYHAHLYPK